MADILTYDEYAEIEAKGFKLPYIVEVAHGNQNLLFYGSDHLNNPDHPQFQDIENRWNNFVTDAANPVALVEGRFDEVKEEDTADRNKSIIDGGEAQFVVHLARRDNVPVDSPEPDRVWEANELAKEFGRDKVIFYYFIRQLSWWSRFTDKPDVPKEATAMLELMKKSYQWEDVDFSLEGMESIHQELFNKPLNWDDTQWIYDVTTPTPQDYVTNVIARRSGELRDEHILQEIQKYWHEGKSPFLIFGSAHAIRLEPALRKLVVMSSSPSAQTAIDILVQLRDKVGPATLAYLVTPNSILTLSGARAYCDGVFYHSSKKQLTQWTAEMAQSIEALKSITDIYFAEAKVDKSTSKESYAGYDAVFMQGLKFVFGNTKLVNDGASELTQQRLTGEKLVDAICLLLKHDERFKKYSNENLNHMAFGILVGYPDKAILGSVSDWEKDDPFAEPLIDADIRGSWYYICPRPVYSYSRHLVTDPDINAHERLWSTILKDYYKSEFHKQLESDKSFQQKLKQLELLR